MGSGAHGGVWLSKMRDKSQPQTAFSRNCDAFLIRVDVMYPSWLHVILPL